MTVENIKRDFDARRHAVEELRALYAATEGRELTAEEAAQEARIHADVDRLDKAVTQALETAERAKVMDEQEARFLALSAEDPEVKAKAAEQDTLAAFLRGEARSVELPTMDRRDLLVGTATAGGHLVPTNLSRTLWEHLFSVSTVMAAGATIIRTSGGEALDLPRTTSYSTAAIVAEAAAIGESDPAVAKATLNAWKYAFITQLSAELMDDSVVDVEGFLGRQGGVALANGMGAHFISGTGTGQPQGVVTASTQGLIAASATAITGDEVIDLFHSVPDVYRVNATWVMRDATLGLIRKLKDTTGQYLWQPGLALGAPDTILGKPVKTDPAVPAATAGLRSVLFGDLSAYAVRFAGPLRVERSSEFAFANDLVSIRFIQRADGRLVDTNALRHLRQL